MNQQYPIYNPEFFTATILEWKHLLKHDKYKDEVIKSLQFLVAENRIRLFAFVIMPNHIHLIWQPLSGFTPKDVQRSLLSYTSKNFKSDLQKNHPDVLLHFKVEAKDRTFQFWERSSLGIDLYSDNVFTQKLDYIHYNPVKSGLCKYPEDYYYSSAKFYETGVDDFRIISHYKG